MPGTVRAHRARCSTPDSAGAARQLVIFLPGFIAAPMRYRQLLEGIAATGPTVIALQLYRPSPAVLSGRFGPEDEASLAADVVRGLAVDADTDQVWLGGHSRGGQAAWLAAAMIEPDGLIVVDPVDGAGRNPSRLRAASEPASFASRVLIIGAGRAGRCAPSAVNHEHFARVAPKGAAHIVVDAMGHGDILNDRDARVAKRLCNGSDRPAEERATVTAIASAFIADRLDQLGPTPTPFTRRSRHDR